MVDEDKSRSPGSHSGRQQQGQLFQQHEARLGTLAAQRKEEEFFKCITPLVGPLKDYIKRRVRIAFLDLEIRTPMYTARDILDQTILRAFENYQKRPRELTLEQWLYQIANHVLDDYIRKASTEKRRTSLEMLNQKELRTLEEIPYTADAEGEVWLAEELDDSELAAPHLRAPADTTNPEENLEKREEAVQILQALSRLPDRDRIVFDLYAIEGFSKDEVARMLNISADDILPIIKNVRQQLKREIPERRATRDVVRREAS